MDMTGLMADVTVREAESDGERAKGEPERTRPDHPACSAEPLIATDKYRFATPAFRPDDLRD